MSPMTAGFGEIDPEQENDFTSILAPRRPAEVDSDPAPPAPLKSSPAGKKAEPTTKKGAQAAKKAPDSVQEAPTGADVAEEPDRVDVEPSAAPRRRGRPPGSGARTSTSQATTPPLVLWTPERIRARMQAVRTSTGKLYLDQVLDALEACVDDLDELVARETAPKTVQTGLFVREQAAPAGSEPRKQLTIRGVLQSQIDVIDALAESTGAGSRSKLINVALDKHLP